MEGKNNNGENSQLSLSNEKNDVKNDTKNEVQLSSHYISQSARPLAQATSILSIIQSVLVSLFLISMIIVVVIAFAIAVISVQGINPNVNLATIGFAGLAGTIAYVVLGIILLITIIISIILMVWTIKDAKNTSKTKFYNSELFALNKKVMTSIVVNFILFALFVGVSIFLIIKQQILIAIIMIIISLIYATISTLKIIDLKDCKEKYKTLSEDEKTQVYNYYLSLKNIK